MKTINVSEAVISMAKTESQGRDDSAPTVNVKVLISDEEDQILQEVLRKTKWAFFGPKTLKWRVKLVGRENTYTLKFET